MFFLLCAMVVLMLLVPFAAGIFAGSREGKKTFFVTLGGAVLFELLFILITFLARGPLLAALFEALRPNLSALPVPMDPFLLLKVLPAAGVPALAGIVLFLLAWNCSRNSTSLWKGLAWSAASFFWYGWIFFLPLGAALWAVFALCTAPRHVSAAGLIMVYGALLWGLLAGVIWTFFTFGNAKRDFRHILRAGAVYAGAVLLFWGGTALTGILMVRAMDRRAAELHIRPETVRQKVPEELKPVSDRTDAFWTENMRYSPPFSGIRDWNDGPGAVSPELRRFTLKFFDGPEVRQYVEDQKRLARLMEKKDELYPTGLLAYRGLIRSRCDRAALFSIAGRKEKVLPELLLAAEELKIIREDSPIRLAQLVRAAAEVMWLSVLIPFAPDGPEYASFYRKLLDEFRRDRITLPHEAGACLGLTDSPSGPLQRVFCRCAFDTFRSAGFFRAVEKIPRLRELEKREVFTGPLGYDERHALTLRRNQVLCRLELALKCYRSEKGKYPASLRELVPLYLEKIPPDPVTGKSVAYSSDGKDFKLSLAVSPGDSNSRPLDLGSRRHVK